MRSASRIIIGFILALIFGRFVPLLLVLLILFLPVVIINNAIKEGKFL